MIVPAEGVVARVEVDGVPVFWSEAPGPGRLALVFRTGRADEPLARAGLTHLIEHLALFALGVDDRQRGGFVDHLRTVFFATGSDSQLAEFAAGVSAALTELPLERAEEEKRVLLTEAETVPSGSWHRLMGLRFGAQGFGLVDFQELGLRRPGTSEVSAWCRQRFVSGNAAIWMTGPPPESLGLRLPSADRLLPPKVLPIPGLKLPAYVATDGGGVAASFVGRRSVALTIALTLLQRRLHEGLRLRRALSYAATGSYFALSAESAHLTLGADCLDEHATAVRDQLVEELQRLATDGPEDSELSSATDMIVAAWAEDPTVVLADLDAAATNELLNAPQTSREELRDEYRRLTPAAVAAAVAEILPTALLAAPTGDTGSAGFDRYETGRPVRLKGRRYLRRGKRARDLPRRSRFIGSEEGMYLADPPSEPLTIRFDQVAAALELGPGRFAITAVNGDWMRVDTNMLFRGSMLERQIRASVADDLFIPYQPRAGASVVDLSREKLGFRTPVAREIELLPSRLEPGEQVLTVAVAVHKRQSGLLALTNRRLIHLSRAKKAKPRSSAVQLSEVAGVRPGRLELLARRLVVKSSSGKTYTFSYIRPDERAAEVREALATPLQPQFTPRPVDTSPAGRFRAYEVSTALFLLAVVAFAAHFWAGALIPLVWGSRLFLGTYRRRRERARYGSD